MGRNIIGIIKLLEREEDGKNAKKKIGKITLCCRLD